MTPPVLIDVNNDEIEDIIIPLYNSTLFVFDGSTFQQLWHRTFPNSETYRFNSISFFFFTLKHNSMSTFFLVHPQLDILMMTIYLIL